MTALYEISNELLSLLSKEELLDDDLALLDALSGDFNAKAVNVAAFLLSLQSELNGVCEAMERMKQRSLRLSKKIDWLSCYLKGEMVKVGVNKISDCPDFEIKLHKKRSSVDVTDETLIPWEYLRKREVVTVNKDAIRADIEQGVIVPGATLKEDKRLVIE